MITNKYLHLSRKVFTQSEIGEIIFDTSNFEYSTYWSNKLKIKDGHPIQQQKVLKNTEKVRELVVGNELQTYNDMVYMIADGIIRAELLKEYIFEDIRREHFSNKPSRQKCIFLSDSQANPEDIRQSFDLNTEGWPSSILVEILDNDSKLHYADASLLNCGLNSFQEIKDNACQYWDGSSKPSQPEYLFEGKLKLIEIL